MTPARVGIFVFAASLGVGPRVAAAGEGKADMRRSGFEFMSPATQALQRDDSQNPAMLAVADGEALWNREAGTAKRSCADCHGAATRTMRGVAARYPGYDRPSMRALDLGQRINLCRQRHQQATPFAAESPELLGLLAYVALQSRGLPITPANDPELGKLRERGAALYRQRIGQLDLACAQCHDQNPGKRLGGSVIPQGHPTGYPVYRLEWQAMGSLQRRLRGCFAGVRAQAPDYGSQSLVELELYLAARAAGMTVDAPGVRP